MNTEEILILSLLIIIGVLVGFILSLYFTDLSEVEILEGVLEELTLLNDNWIDLILLVSGFTENDLNYNPDENIPFVDLRKLDGEEL